MFCVGSKIILADGRVAVARNGADIVRILSMNSNITSIACKADSLALNVDGITFEDVQKIAVCFMDTGEKAAGYAWEKA